MTDLNRVSEEMLIEAWIRYETEPLRQDRDSDFWAVKALMDASSNDPEKAFRLVLRILGRNSSTAVVEVLSAGALEDILAKHGARFISRIETEARKNPKFASLLGGVWQNNMSDEIFERVKRVWNRSGWDGNP